MSTQLDLQRLSIAANLASNGDKTAVATSNGVLTYRELAERVEDLGRRLCSGRRLVALTATFVPQTARRSWRSEGRAPDTLCTRTWRFC
jgi:hypothetical protein